MVWGICFVTSWGENANSLLLHALCSCLCCGFSHLLSCIWILDKLAAMRGGDPSGVSSMLSFTTLSATLVSLLATPFVRIRLNIHIDLDCYICFTSLLGDYGNGTKIQVKRWKLTKTKILKICHYVIFNDTPKQLVKFYRETVIPRCLFMFHLKTASLTSSKPFPPLKVQCFRPSARSFRAS